MTPIEFEELSVPGFLSMDHVRRGGRNLKRYVATVADGILRVMVAQEPAGKEGTLIWHISATIAANGDIGSPPLRLPTDDELEATKALVPGIVFEKDSARRSAAHLWESEQ